MAQVILLLGTNLGDKKMVLKTALGRLERIKCAVTQVSPIYETPAWGFQSGHAFYNQVVKVETATAPEELLQQLKRLELELGRDPLKQSVNGVYQDRLIDIDILFYNEEIYQSPTLTIPHPRLHLRRFTLVPLYDVCPNLVHPKLQQSTAALLQNCTDTTIPVRVN